MSLKFFNLDRAILTYEYWERIRCIRRWAVRRSPGGRLQRLACQLNRVPRWGTEHQLQRWGSL